MSSNGFNAAESNDPNIFTSIADVPSSIPPSIATRALHARDPHPTYVPGTKGGWSGGSGSGSGGSWSGGYGSYPYYGYPGYHGYPGAGSGSGGSNGGSGGNGGSGSNGHNNGHNRGGGGGGGGGGSTGQSHHGGLSRGAKIGLGIGIPLAILALLLLGCFLYRRRKQRDLQQKLRADHFMPPVGAATGLYVTNDNHSDYSFDSAHTKTSTIIHDTSLANLGEVAGVAAASGAAGGALAAYSTSSDNKSTIVHDLSYADTEKKTTFESTSETNNTSSSSSAKKAGLFSALTGGAVAAAAGLFRKKRTPTVVSSSSSESEIEVMEEVVTTTTTSTSESEQHQSSERNASSSLNDISNSSSRIPDRSSSSSASIPIVPVAPIIPQRTEKLSPPMIESTSPPKTVTFADTKSSRKPSPPRVAEPIAIMPTDVSFSSEESVVDEVVEEVVTTTTTQQTTTEQRSTTTDTSASSIGRIEEPPSTILSNSPDTTVQFGDMGKRFDEVIRETSVLPSSVSTDNAFGVSQATDGTEEIITTAATTVTTTVAYTAETMSKEVHADGSSKAEMSRYAAAAKRTEVGGIVRPQLKSRAPLMIDELGRRKLPPPPRPPPTSHVVVHTHIPMHEDELKLETGDLIGIEEDLKDGWAIGQNITNGRARGLFPLDYVKPIRSGPSQRVTQGNMRDRSASGSSNEEIVFSPSVPRRTSVEPSFDASVESYL